jgi:phenylacetate-CoA ligase
MGYPSSLEILCSYLDECGFELDWSPKMVLFSSEPMYDHQQKVISKVIGTGIAGLYGSGERMVSASQCSSGTYHLSIVDGFVEGQFGIMENIRPAAVTSLTNRVMPLIRYQLGDVIETQPDLACGCGRTLPAMSPVITKDEDWIITPSGRKISPSAVVWAFIHQDIEGVTNGQVVQHDRESVTVYLNTNEDNYIRYKEILQESMEKVFFGEMNINIVRTDRIDVNRAGKSRFIVNELRQRK